MGLVKALLHDIANQSLSHNERTRLRCRLAGRLGEAGNYEAARDVMGELWRQVGERPNLGGLDESTTATVLLRVGALTRDLGSVAQIEGAYEAAKDLLTESMSLFEALESPHGVAEALIEMAVSYRREGAFDQARAMLQTALQKLGSDEIDLTALAMLRSATVEGSAGRFQDALRIYTDAGPLVEKTDDLILRGKFHHCFGTLLKKLGEAEQRPEYIDRALIEFAAASFYFEQAELTRHQAAVENNLGFLFGTIGRLPEAHYHLDRAQALFTSLKDKVHLAQVDETRARIMLTEGRLVEAERLIGNAVGALENGSELSLLVEALVTQGVAQARLQDLGKAQATLRRAKEIAEVAGDAEGAGQATLSMIEQLGDYFSLDDLKTTVDQAWELLENTQNMFTLKRLIHCTKHTLSRIHGSARFPASVDWATFSFKEEVRQYEAHFIKLALQDSSGKVTRAALLLGLPNHQTLVSMLETRHTDLLTVRLPKRSRKSIIVHHDANAKSGTKSGSKVRTARVLYVEDNETVAAMVKDSLEANGLIVETSTNGTLALERIASNSVYDLLLLDNEVPGTIGVELVRRARQLDHRRGVPIILLSGTLDESAAYQAGADAYLPKPENVSAVAETVARLIESKA